VPVTINTLENVLFMELINDISFEIGGKLVVLIEHQSSVNQNMPLWLLMYIEGRNDAIARRCRKLAEYSAFIAKAREFERELGDREEALKATINYCREHDILKEFLEKHATEVISMLITEWNTDEAKKVWYEEGGEEEREKIVKNALAKGYPLDTIHAIIGLDMETIRDIQARQ